MLKGRVAHDLPCVGYETAMALHRAGLRLAEGQRPTWVWTGLEGSSPEVDAVPPGSNWPDEWDGLECVWAPTAVELLGWLADRDHLDAVHPAGPADDAGRTWRVVYFTDPVMGMDHDYERHQSLVEAAAQVVLAVLRTEAG